MFSRFILCVGIIIISKIYFCYLYCVVFIYLYLTNVIVLLFISIFFHFFGFCLCVRVYTYSFFPLVLYHSYCVMFIVYVYAFRHKYIFCFAFICLHVCFLFGLSSLGVNIHTWARLDMDGIDTNKDVVENAHMGRGGAYRVQHFLCEHGMWVFHRKYSYVGILKHRPLSMG